MGCVGVEDKGAGPRVLVVWNAGLVKVASCNEVESCVGGKKVPAGCMQEQRLNNLVVMDHPHHALWNGSRQWNPQPDNLGRINSSTSHVPIVAFRTGNLGWSRPWDILTEPSHFNPSLIHDPYTEALGTNSLSAGPRSTREPNLGIPWKSSNILIDDIACVELSADDLALRADFRMAVILHAIVRGTRQ